jgi:competence protein ComEC
MWGLAPVAAATALLIATPVPDVLISGDGRHVGITGEGPNGTESLLVLRDTRSDYTRENLLELAGMDGAILPLAQWDGARCSRDACTMVLERGGRSWSLLMTRSNTYLPWRELTAACREADIVVSDRRLPEGCEPRWLKADSRMLRANGGLAIDLARREVTSVAQSQGEQGWWRGSRP